MRPKLLVTMLVVLWSSVSVWVFGDHETAMINVDGRQKTSLNGQWHIIVDPFEKGYYDYRYQVDRNGYFKNRKPKNKSELVEYDFDTSSTLHVPGDWNTQRNDLFFYEGTVWYKRDFDYRLGPDRRLFVYFGAANYHAVVYLNGEKLGEHIGGFTPFQFEITDKVRPKDNFLVVKVDNKRKAEAVPAVNRDWWNFGGLTRRVLLLETPKTYIKDYFIQLKKDSANEIAGWVVLDGDDKQKDITIEIPQANVKKTFTTNEQGRAQIDMSAELTLWTSHDPKLYDVVLSTEAQALKDKIGFRSIATKDSDILLNGKSLFLRGICIHEESPYGSSRAHSPEDAAVLLGWAKELGCNFVRLAHYPHNEAMIRKADEMGLLVWSEIPVYWTILWENEETYQNAKNQLTEMITRDKNRACIILWSMANETPVSEPRGRFLKNLAATARELDPTRLITAANEKHRQGNTVIVDDPFGEYLDVLGCNEYYGWYEGMPDICDDKLWQVKLNKPLIMSELGGGALYGFHADEKTRWSEEFQADIYRHQLPMLKKIDSLRGLSPWILKDFRAPRRTLPKIQDYWNRKGLISDHGERKKAFYILQDFYHEIAQNENKITR